MKVMTDIKEAIRHGRIVADSAAVNRQDLRWNVKPGDPEREAIIAEILEEIREAMVPIRELQGKAIWGKVPGNLRKPLTDVSARLQYERKQLKKMRRT